MIEYIFNYISATKVYQNQQTTKIYMQKKRFGNPFITHVGPASLRALHTLTKTKMHYEKENLSNHYNVQLLLSSSVTDASCMPLFQQF